MELRMYDANENDSCYPNGHLVRCGTADFDQDKIKAGWKNIQVVQALKPVPGNGQVPLCWST